MTINLREHGADMALKHYVTNKNYFGDIANKKKDYQKLKKEKDIAKHAMEGYEDYISFTYKRFENTDEKSMSSKDKMLLELLYHLKKETPN